MRVWLYRSRRRSKKFRKRRYSVEVCHREIGHRAPVTLVYLIHQYAIIITRFPEIVPLEKKDEPLLLLLGHATCSSGA